MTTLAGLGHQLRAMRAASGRTVASVASGAGLSVPYVANLENGRGNPTISALGRLAAALNIQLAVSLEPADRNPRSGPANHVDIPQSLVRLGRTERFRATTETMSQKLGTDPGDVALPHPHHPRPGPGLASPRSHRSGLLAPDRRADPHRLEPGNPAVTAPAHPNPDHPQGMQADRF